MALLERVTTLIRANLNDLIDKAEDPEKMIKQVILDMQNQLLQLKTQVAIAIADHHLLVKKRQENENLAADWVRKAEFAVDRQQEDLGRVAIEKSISFRRSAESFAQQIEDQNVQVETLKTALTKLQVKLAETQAHAEVLLAQHRRSRMMKKAADARWKVAEMKDAGGAFNRMKNKVQETEAVGRARNQMLDEDPVDRLESLEHDEEVERLLEELRDRNKKKPA
jgi:phage shock protein A